MKHTCFFLHKHQKSHSLQGTVSLFSFADQRGRIALPQPSHSSKTSVSFRVSAVCFVDPTTQEQRPASASEWYYLPPGTPAEVSVHTLTDVSAARVMIKQKLKELDGRPDASAGNLWCSFLPLERRDRASPPSASPAVYMLSPASKKAYTVYLDSLRSRKGTRDDTHTSDWRRAEVEMAKWLHDTETNIKARERYTRATDFYSASTEDINNTFPMEF